MRRFPVSGNGDCLRLCNTLAFGRARGKTMKRFASFAAHGLTTFGRLGGGCATPEHRMNVAADRDQERRADFEQCRAQGGSNCDAILNAPVDSNTTSGDAIREHERRAAYDRCVTEGGSDCSALLR